MSCLLAKYNNQLLPIDDYDKKVHTEETKCNCCDTEVIAKKGPINVHHYAHTQNNDCPFTKKEHKTPWHKFWQEYIKPEFLEKIIIKDNKKHIADIKNTDNIVIEIQHSNISLTDVFEREKFYENMIWILDGNSILNKSGEVTRTIEIAFEFRQDNIDYYMIKTTKKFWSYLEKTKYIDTSLGILEIVREYYQNYYLCKQLEIKKFMQKYFTNITKCKIDKFVNNYEKLRDKNMDKMDNREIKNIVLRDKFKNDFNTNTKITYYSKNDTFYGVVYYSNKNLLIHLGYVNGGGSKYIFKGNPKQKYTQCDICDEIYLFLYTYNIETIINNHNFGCAYNEISNDAKYIYCDIKYCYKCFNSKFNPSKGNDTYKLSLTNNDTLTYQLSAINCTSCGKCCYSTNLFDSFKINDNFDYIFKNIETDITFRDQNNFFCLSCFKIKYNPSTYTHKYKLVLNDNLLTWNIVEINDTCNKCDCEIVLREYGILFDSFCIHNSFDYVDSRELSKAVYRKNNKLFCLACFKLTSDPSSEDKIYRLEINKKEVIWKLYKVLEKCDVSNKDVNCKLVWKPVDINIVNKHDTKSNITKKTFEDYFKSV